MTRWFLNLDGVWIDTTKVVAVQEMVGANGMKFTMVAVHGVTKPVRVDLPVFEVLGRVLMLSDHEQACIASGKWDSVMDRRGEER